MFTNRLDANNFYAEVLSEAETKGAAIVDAVIRQFALNDLWFLLTVVLGRNEMNTSDELKSDWLYDRCKEVQADPDGYLDIWAREHYKSTIITYAKSIQDILIDPEVTIGIFSVKRELAQDFLKQIKQEFENNETLKRVFSDILYEDPENQSEQWGIEKGIRVRRKSIRREETVEAWGLFSLPTGKHFGILIFDDVVTEKSVTNHDQLSKAFAQLRSALLLGSHGGRRRMIGTIYHFNDAWRQSMKADIAKKRMYAATEDGSVKGKGVLLTQAALAKKWLDSGSYIFACQMLLNPKADEAQGFNRDWLRAWTPKPEFWSKMNIYILVDPAGARKIKEVGHDYTVMWVIGLAPDGRRYLIDGLRDRLNLTQRCSKLFSFVRTYDPIRVGYEQYGMQADIAHIEKEQFDTNFHFDIVELGGSMPKNDRIRMLVPEFEHGRFFTPGHLTIKDASGAYRDIMQEFVDEEFDAFPVATHDDMLDDMARILDPKLEAVFPNPDEYAKIRGGYPNVPRGDVSVGVGTDPLEEYAA